MQAKAESYPGKPITLIVPFSPGGPTDVTARLFAREIAVELGQPVIVDNRPGAGGTMGAGSVARAKADGYTLLWGGTSTLAVAPALYSRIPYDPLASFQPVGRPLRGPLVLVVNASLPVKSVKELVALARAEPDAFNYGSAGVGSVIHLTAEMFRHASDIRLTHIPYKGNADVMAGLTGGTFHLAFVALGQVLPYLGSEKIRPLAITSLQRNSLAPEIPTMAESGFPGFESMEWFGLLAPAAIPPDVLSKLSLAFRHVGQKVELKKSLVKLGYSVVSDTPQEFSAAIREETAKWRGVVARANVRVE